MTSMQLSKIREALIRTRQTWNVCRISCISNDTEHRLRRHATVLNVLHANTFYTCRSACMLWCATSSLSSTASHVGPRFNFTKANAAGRNAPIAINTTHVCVVGCIVGGFCWVCLFVKNTTGTLRLSISPCIEIRKKKTCAILKYTHKNMKTLAILQ